MKLSQKLLEERTARGMSQAGFEKITGVKREYLSRIENGHLKNPTLNFIRKAAAGFNISMAVLLEDVD